MVELVKACRSTDLKEGILTPIDIEGIKLMGTIIEGKFIIASRICTHKTYDLTKGILSEGYVTCILHTSTFDLTSDGEAMNPPATEPLEMYKVIEKDGFLYIELN